jgi:hypothetical protein
MVMNKDPSSSVKRVKVKISLLQAMEAHRVEEGPSQYIKY